MSKKSKKNRYSGLKFNYKIGETVLMDKYLTIDDFLFTSFPKNNNPMSPKYDTKIFNLKWNNNDVFIAEKVNTVNDLIEILKREDIFVSNADIRFGRFKPKEYLIRKEIYSIEEVRDKVKDVLFEKDKKLAKVDFDGDLIKGNSQRYQTFFTKGCKCAVCGIEGKYFAKERHLQDKSYHLNLYAVDNNGDEILMTKDHIMPHSKGGIDDISNYQTMCKLCNEAKGNKLED